MIPPSNIAIRGLTALNLRQYAVANYPERVDSFDLNIPEKRQYILRVLVKRPFEDFGLPPELSWLKLLIEKASQYQLNVLRIKQPFCYITVRSGIVDSVTDDEWHVDGFSQTITHLPEQNYIWTDHTPTEFVARPFLFPKDFDTSKHNIHLLFQDSIIKSTYVFQLNPKTLYCLDPYVVHRRPILTKGIHRTFVRLSFTPIEIIDCNNTFNPLLPTDYRRDGRKDFMNQLARYDLTK